MRTSSCANTSPLAPYTVVRHQIAPFLLPARTNCYFALVAFPIAQTADFGRPSTCVCVVVHVYTVRRGDVPRDRVHDFHQISNRWVNSEYASYRRIGRCLVRTRVNSQGIPSADACLPLSTQTGSRIRLSTPMMLEMVFAKIVLPSYETAG